jgi:hypothetical protein
MGQLGFSAETVPRSAAVAAAVAARGEIAGTSENWKKLKVVDRICFN